MAKKSPPKRETKKDKVVEHTLTSGKETKNATLKPHQKPVANFLRANDISVILSDAGCSKDFVQMYRAIEGVNNKEFEKIVICKPILEIGGKGIGFLPGAQPYSSKILTPTGWVTMGEIKEGDYIFAFDGTVVKVTGTFEKGIRDVYEVTTLQGKKTLVCDKHLWEVQESNYKRKYNKPKIVDTTYIKDNIINEYGKYRFALPMNKSVEFIKNDLPLHPYIIGCMIGDGCCGESLSISNIDEELLLRFSELISPLGCTISEPKRSDQVAWYIKSSSENNKPGKSVKITNLENGDVLEYDRIGEALKEQDILRSTLNTRCFSNSVIDGKKYEFIDDTVFSTNPVKNIINDLGLLGLKSYEKFIPSIYKYSSYEDRLELLKGLLDTDGNVKTNGEVNFTTTSKLLAEDVLELVRSMGGRAYICVRDRRGDKPRMIKGRNLTTRRISYQIGISFSNMPEVFHITRKKERLKTKSNLHKDFIKSVIYVGQEEVKCIKIDHPRELYITDDYIVTHNTLEEKTDVYLKSFYDNIAKIVGKENVNSIMKKIQFEHTGFQRGNTMPENSVIILSEIQNLTASEAHSYLTRVPQSSKLFCNGDASQSDLGMKSGLNDFLESISGVNGVGIAILDGDVHQMRRKEIIEITNNYINIQKRKGSFFTLDTNRFEYIEL